MPTGPVGEVAGCSPMTGQVPAAPAEIASSGSEILRPDRQLRELLGQILYGTPLAQPSD